MILFAGSVTSCETIPGMAEPDIIVCTILDMKIADCFSPSDPNHVPKDVPLRELIGFSCVSPSSYGQVDNHHNALHLKIKELMGSE